MPAIHHRTYIRVPAEQVYQTLTTADGWNAWFTDDTTITLDESGTGSLRFRWQSGQNSIEDGGPILKAVPEICFIFQWQPGQQATTIAFELYPFREGTLVKLSETGYTTAEADLDACIHCAAGWGEALILLKLYLETGAVFKADLQLN